MWKILMPKLLTFIQTEAHGLAAEIEAKANNDIEELLLLLTSNDFRDTLSAILTANVNPNFKYWWSYMDMIEILLMFTRVQRKATGNFTCMPFSECFRTL